MEGIEIGNNTDDTFHHWPCPGANNDHHQSFELFVDITLFSTHPDNWDSVPEEAAGLQQLSNAFEICIQYGRSKRVWTIILDCGTGNNNSDEGN